MDDPEFIYVVLMLAIWVSVAELLVLHVIFEVFEGRQ